MPFVQKPLYASRDWRGEKAPPLSDAQIQWCTAEPSLAGKVLLIEFWATWCGKCHQKIPMFNDIQATFKDDVVVIGLTEELPDSVRPELQTNGVQYYVASDVGGKYHNLITVEGLPNLIIIDPEGVVQWQGLPNAEDAKDPFNKELVQQIITLSKLAKLPAAKFSPITENLISSPQPNIAQLKNLAVVGIKSVLNLRTKDEKGVIPHEEKLMSPDIVYHQIPILYLNDIDETNVEEITSKISSLPKPCLVHCNVGLCSSAAILLSVAKEQKKNGQGITRQQFLEWGAGLGFNFADQPKFYDFLGRYLG
eukprot:Phypoly_transcript_06309.p1 GENE.Phypoly_transcript_06309~~Phypoly_transcript_06309.p1  ORF type:complete len:308 (+),score=44.80 Phypoly_transcript_06309:842-1765(+)